MKNTNKKYILFVLILAILIFIPVLYLVNLHSNSHSKPITLSTKEKVEDFNYMFDVIEKSYPFLEVNKRINNLDWKSNKDAYLKRIESTKTDDDFIKEISLILNDLNNGHTEVISNSDGYNFLKDVYSKTNWYDFWNDSTVNERYNNSNENFKKKNSEINFSSKKFILKDIVYNKIGYIYIPQMLPSNNSIEEDMATIKNYIQLLDNHKALIIDIRGNAGGNDMYWHSLLSLITNKPLSTTGYVLFRNNSIVNNYIEKRLLDTKPITSLPKSILENAPKEALKDFNCFSTINNSITPNPASKFDGNIYLLVDNNVFSSSESFAIFCKDSNFATLIGTTTAGDGGGYDPILFNLKNSGLIVRFASDMFLTSSGICNEEFKTTPDFLIENFNRTNNFNDDMCIQKVLELENVKGKIN